MAKILLVEDNPDLAQVVIAFLKSMHHSVEHISNGRDASTSLRINSYDVIVMDWELPEVAGVDICREYRVRGGNTPVLMLTGRREIDDKSAGFDAGADDYLTKPFQMPELGMRISALLNRSREVKSKIFSVGKIELDPQRKRVTVDGATVDLLKKEFSVLEFLMRNPGHVFTFEAILARVWESDTDATTEAVKTVVKRLRRKIDPDGVYVKTHHGVGYSLEGS